LSDEGDDPADAPGGPDLPEAADVEVLPEVPAVDDEAASEAYQQRARLAEDRLAEVLTAYREFRRETEAYRERLTRQLQRRFEQRHEGLLLKFIDVLDNFDRALEASQTAGNSLVEGLILVRTQLVQMLQDEGLERIPVLGLPFDPHVSEAVATVAVEDSDQHQVVMQEMLRGYRIKGRIARASRVVIGEYRGGTGEAAHPARHPQDVLIGEAIEEAVTAIIMKPEPEPDPAPLEATDSGPSLEEIIARAEARDSGQPPPQPEVEILYDDLTELTEVEDVVGVSGDDASPGKPDDEE
jgi:molecular chaperone GrpE